MIFGQVTLPNLFEPVPACDPLSGEVVLAPLRRQHMGAEAGHRSSEDRRVRAAHVQGAGNRACGEDRPVVKGSVWKERPCAVLEKPLMGFPVFGTGATSC